jgi:polysaccharide export outer membrane protein
MQSITLQKLGLAALLVPMSLVAQTSTAAAAPPAIQSAAPTASPGYLLGPGDQITIFVADLPDEFADKTFRIDNSGDVSLPVIGHLHAGGLTASGLEAAARQHLAHVLKNPDVSISLATFGSQSVYILGAVNNPGAHQLEGHKNLFEILSLAGGLSEDAGYSVNVTRKVDSGPIPLPHVVTDPSGQTYVTTIKLSDIINATDPAENIVILPGDTVSVPKADVVYAVGSVTKPGGFPLNQHESLSALQVVSLAQGAKNTAALDKAQILRRVPGSTSRTEIAVNLKQLMAGKGTDIQLQPDDILFVPNSAAKTAGYKTIDSIVAAATGFAVFGSKP